MAATAKHHEVEQRFRQLVAEAEIPEPDEVVYDPTAVGFYWHERKVVVFVDLDDPADAGSSSPVRPDPDSPVTPDPDSPVTPDGDSPVRPRA